VPFHLFRIYALYYIVRAYVVVYIIPVAYTHKCCYDIICATHKTTRAPERYDRPESNTILDVGGRLAAPARVPPDQPTDTRLIYRVRILIISIVYVCCVYVCEWVSVCCVYVCEWVSVCVCVCVRCAAEQAHRSDTDYNWPTDGRLESLFVLVPSSSEYLGPFYRTRTAVRRRLIHCKRNI